MKKTINRTAFGLIFGELTEDRYCFYSSTLQKSECVNIDGENVYIYATKDNGKPLEVKVSSLTSLNGALDPDKAAKIVKKATSLISSLIRDITPEMRLEMRLDKLTMQNRYLKESIAKSNAAIVEAQGKIALNESEYRRIASLKK